MRRLLPLAAALPLVFVLSALTTGCSRASSNNKPGLVTSWGKDGVVQLPGFEVKQTIEDPSGRIVAVGNYKGNYAQVVRLLPDGSLDPSFGQNGVVRWPFHMFQGRFPNGMDFLGWDLAALLPSGRVVLAGTNMVGNIDNKTTLVVSEIDQSGKVVKTFGDEGYFTADKRLYDCSAAAAAKGSEACDRQFFGLARRKTTCTRGPAGLAVQGEKIVISADRFCNYSDPILHIVVMRLNANGTRDRSFGKKSEVTVSGTAPLVVSAPLTVLPNDHLVVAGTTQGEKVQLTELLPDGAINRSFGQKGVVFTRAAESRLGFHNLTALVSDEHGTLSLTGNNDEGPFLVRFTSSGQPLDFRAGSRRSPSIRGKGNYENFGTRTFGIPYALFAELPSGELVGAGNRLARITAKGVLDPSYPPQELYGGGKLIIGGMFGGILAASDGTVLVTLLKQNPSETLTANLARYR
jgi:uncharacterized delta-60 repeat protein